MRSGVWKILRLIPKSITEIPAAFYFTKFEATIFCTRTQVTTEVITTSVGTWGLKHTGWCEMDSRFTWGIFRLQRCAIQLCHCHPLVSYFFYCQVWSWICCRHSSVSCQTNLCPKTKGSICMLSLLLWSFQVQHVIFPVTSVDHPFLPRIPSEVFLQKDHKR
jgi:hypothetical protein